MWGTPLSLAHAPWALTFASSAFLSVLVPTDSLDDSLPGAEGWAKQESRDNSGGRKVGPTFRSPSGADSTAVLVFHVFL